MFYVFMLYILVDFRGSIFYEMVRQKPEIFWSIGDKKCERLLNFDVLTLSLKPGKEGKTISLIYSNLSSIVIIQRMGC